VKPSMGEGRFMPFVTLGLGPSFVSFRKRVDRQATGLISVNNPYTDEYYYPGGIGFTKNAGLGGEFSINEKVFIGLDIRYFFLTIPDFDQDELDVIDQDSDSFAENWAVKKDFQYNNGSVFLYSGLRF